MTGLSELRRLFLEDTNEPQRLPPNITKPDEILPRPPYRNPSAYSISVLTLVCNIGGYIDIDTRSFFESVGHHTLLPHKQSLDKGDYSCLPGILDIQYVSLSYGCTSFGEKKNKSERKKTFSNQCTMRVLFEDSNRADGYNIINVKLFNNGTLAFTGIKSVSEAKECTNIIVEHVNRLRLISKVHEQIIDFCNGTPSFVNKKIKILNYIANNRKPNNVNISRILEVKPILMLLIKKMAQKDIFRLSMTCKYFDQLLSHKNSTFWKVLTFDKFKDLYIKHPELPKHYIDYQTCNTYIPKVSVKYEYFKRCEKRYNYKPNALLSSPDNTQLKMSNGSIEMINSNFTTHFFINQRKLTKLLQDNYPHINSSYEPDDKYHGIKVYWPHPDTVYENGDNTNAVHIFISIFRTGSIVMSGAKTTQQLNDAYKFVNGIIKQYYSKIWIPNDT